METLVAFIITVAVAAFFLRGYLKGLKGRDERARKSAEKGKLYSEGPKSQHPHIDTAYCIGCATCTSVCPEGDVLAMIAGKAAIVNVFTKFTVPDTSTYCDSMSGFIQGNDLIQIFSRQ